MKLQLYYQNKTHSYNKPLTIQSLRVFCQQSFQDLLENFTFIYQSSKGELTYIESDADLIGLKCINSLSGDSMIKLSILRSSGVDEFGIDEDIETFNIVKEEIEQNQDNVFIKLQDEVDNEAVREYLNQTYDKFSFQMAQVQVQEDFSLIDITDYLTNLYEKCTNDQVKTRRSFVIQKPKITKRVRFSPAKPATYRSQKSIDKIVSQKVLQMIPSLVDKIYAKFQSKVGGKCPNCFQKEIQLEKVIDEEISRRVSLCIYDENPEQ